MTAIKTASPRRTSSGPEPRSELPRLGWRGGLRYLWTQLTSMRTALILLFALALAAIPGSLVPQRRISPVRVADFINAASHAWPDLRQGRAVRGLQLAMVLRDLPAALRLPRRSHHSRVGVYAKALRARPPKTPRNLARLPAYAKAEIDNRDEDPLGRAAAELRRRHYRVDVNSDSVAAERGYLREAESSVPHQPGFCAHRGRDRRTVRVPGYECGDRRARLFQHPHPIRRFFGGRPVYRGRSGAVQRNRQGLRVRFETGAVQRGAARLFRANVEVTEQPGAAPRQEVLEVNKPLHVGGTTVHLIATVMRRRSP